MNEELKKPINQSEIYVVFDNDDVAIISFDNREDCIAFCISQDFGWKQLTLKHKPQPAPANLKQVWNAITANGCREMDFERFQQAVKECGVKTLPKP